MTSRRSFMKSTAAIGAATAFAGSWREAYAFSQTPSVVPLFVNKLRIPGPDVPPSATDPLGNPGIPVAAGTPGFIGTTPVVRYELDVQQYTDNITVSGWTTNLWGYNPRSALAQPGQPQRHLGGIIIGEKGKPIQIRFYNKLRSSAAAMQGPGGTATATPKHILPNDMTIMGAMDGDFRLATHFHGGLVPWISDGGPDAWFDDTRYGPAATLNPATNGGISNIFQAVDPQVPTGAAEYFYPLNQSARFGWYHDHALGITRLNAYAGVASGLIIRDSAEAGLVATQGLPPYIETSLVSTLTGTPMAIQELPLVIQDKVFVGTTTAVQDPSWSTVVPPVCTQPGSLWYAHLYEKNRWKLNTGGKGNLLPKDPSVIPEFFGDTMLVNGTAYPVVNVEPRRYRLRLLNACSARFLNLQLYIADATLNGITLNPNTGIPTNTAFTSNLYGTPGAIPTPEVLQIGTEGGFLVNPTLIKTNVPFNPVAMTGSLIVAPAERPDLIIDFAAMAGKDIILYNDAPAPFPMGDPRNDYFPGFNVVKNPVNGTTKAGFGPNSRVLMRFRVGAAASSPDAALLITTQTAMPGIDPLPTTDPLFAGAPVRKVALLENFDAQGRLQQMLAPLTPGVIPVPTASNATATEVVAPGTLEVWEVYNTTADVHPMHWHLVNMQVLSRQAFDVKALLGKGTVTLLGAATLPNANEIGLKETVPMYPGQVTRIAMKFDLPTLYNGQGVPGLPLPFTVPPSPLTGGHDYVWHCHILEHEEHDMMRPLIVK